MHLTRYYWIVLFLLFGCFLEAAPSSQVKPKKALIVLDPGHGGIAIGAHIGKVQEKALALKTAQKVQKILKQLGYRVVMTRTRDEFVGLNKRTKMANQTKCKLFVSIHFNAHPNPLIKGIEVFYYKKGGKWRSAESRKVAKKVLDELVKKTKGRSRGVKHGNFHVIRETLMPAILVEGGFITNAKEREQLASPSHLNDIARAIVAGIEAYFGH